MKLTRMRPEGFTLIELLVVITILGILAALAIPLYRAHTVKARLTEVTNSMSHVASAVVSYYEKNDSFPSPSGKAAIHSTLGVSLANVSRIQAVDVTNGAISVTITSISSQVDGSNLTLSPNVDGDGSISWTWGGTIQESFMPSK
jgi:type IV pilus assembly protein PilA